MPANRLYTCTGQAVLNMQVQVSGGQPVPETWTFLVGPALPQRFIRATASVSVVGYGVWSGIMDPKLPSSSWHSLDIQSVEAD